MVVFQDRRYPSPSLVPLPNIDATQRWTVVFPLVERTQKWKPPLSTAVTLLAPTVTPLSTGVSCSSGASDAENGKDEGAAPADVAGTSMPSEVGESID